MSTWCLGFIAAYRTSDGYSHNEAGNIGDLLVNLLAFGREATVEWIRVAGR